MAKHFQKFIITGNLGREPEQRTSQKGTAMTTFSVATEAALQGADGKPATLWVDVVTTGKQAEFCAQYLHQGDKVLVEGKVQPPRTFTRQNGEAGASLSLWAAPMGVTILQSKNGGNGNGNAASEGVFEDEGASDIPF